MHLFDHFNFLPALYQFLKEHPHPPQNIRLLYDNCPFLIFTTQLEYCIRPPATDAEESLLPGMSN